MNLSFDATSPCRDCPWRRDVKPGKFPPQKFEQWAESCEPGFGAFFQCHQKPVVCVGYLMCPDSLNNNRVRMALIKKQLNPQRLSSKAPLYESYVEMAAANGAVIRLKGSK